MRENDIKGPGGIRFDLRYPLTKPVEKPREIWIDHVLVQETSPTYAKATIEHRQEDKMVMTGPAFHKTQGAKIRQYSTLTAVVRRLVEERKLSFEPEFSFPIVSALGYVNEDMNKLMKLNLERYKEYQLTLQPRLDGIQVKDLRGQFKVQMRNTLAFAVARSQLKTRV